MGGNAKKMGKIRKELGSEVSSFWGEAWRAEAVLPGEAMDQEDLIRVYNGWMWRWQNQALPSNAHSKDERQWAQTKIWNSLGTL